jgi:hypothetical protein
MPRASYVGASLVGRNSTLFERDTDHADSTRLDRDTDHADSTDSDRQPGGARLAGRATIGMNAPWSFERAC